MSGSREAGTRTLDRGGRPHAGVVAGEPRSQRPLQSEAGVVLAQLAPGAVHELNNSLFAILGLLDLLAEDAPPGTRSRDRLELIRASAAEMRDVVRALHSLVPSESVGAASFTDVVRESAALVRRFGLSKDVEIDERYPPERVDAAGDAGELRCASVGLLLGAVRAARPGEQVWVELSREGDWVTLSAGGAPCSPSSIDLELPSAIAQRLGGELGSGETGVLSLRLPAASEQTA